MRLLILLLCIATLDSCCHIPGVNCIAKVKKLKTDPEAILLDNKISKQITVKAWLVESRDKKDSIGALDFQLEFSGDYSASVPVADLIKFNSQNYFLLRGDTILINPATVKTEANNVKNKTQQKITVFFSININRKDIYNPEIKKALVVNDILLADEKIKFESSLHI